jgi:uncharacterized protein YbaP (TraB family)
MKKTVAICIGLLFAVISLPAQQPVKKAVVPARDTLEHSLLWEISGNQMAHPSYLFGTMHMLCAADAQLSDSLRYAIATVKQVYFELNLDNMMETLGGLQYLNMNDHLQLSDLMSESDYQRVKTYFEQNKTMLPFSMMQHLKPYFITALISESKFPCVEKDGMEQVIMKLAKKQSKPIRGLETVKFQASVFDSIPYKRQAADLVKLIDSSSTATDSSDQELADVYRRQDINKMQDLTAGEENMADYLDLLLYNRNRDWASRMPAIMRNGPSLFAVGAGHLGGEKGVIRLLRAAGFTVRSVKHRPGVEMLAN